LQPGGQRRNEPPPDENCLFLNVWTPAADGRKRPVMFYSHGGGFVVGSGGAAYQDGSGLARTWDVVVVPRIIVSACWAFSTWATSAANSMPLPVTRAYWIYATG
jgi:hypothetical protein